MMMGKSALRILHKDDLPLGGFAGIVETRMVMHPTFWPAAKSRKDISHGLEDLIYLASGYFKPNEGAPIHPHKDVDIVSFILNGKVGHQGTLGDGTAIEGPGVQVQRAGTGMQHAEFSLENTQAEIIQIWFKPPENGLKPEYQNFSIKDGGLTTVLGGKDGKSFHNNMQCQIGSISAGQVVRCQQDFVAFIAEGTANANGRLVKQGDLIEGGHLNISSQEGAALILIQASL